MAEVTQMHLELMVQEYEEMVRTNLFTPAESKIIMKRRKEHEYKLRSNSVDAFKEYIEYELCVYRLMKTRRVKLHIIEKKTNMEYKILVRIKKLYERVIDLSEHEIQLYFAYFAFCKETHHITPEVQVCNKMLKCHKNVEKVWLIAARFYLHSRKEYQYALKLLMQGLNSHKGSKNLYRECIQYEVMHVTPNNIKQNKDDHIEIHKALNERLKTYFREMIGCIDEPQFFIDIIRWMEVYDCTLPTQLFIIDEILIAKFSKTDIVWDYLARRERRDVSQTRSTAKILSCIQKYEEGLKAVSPDKLQSLWSLYLDCLIDIKNEEFNAGNIKKKQILKDAFSKASMEHCLPENCYVTWIELVDDREAYSIIKMAVERIPKSADLWKIRVRFELMRDNKIEIDRVFQECINTLTDDALPVWLVMYQYHLLSSSFVEIEDFFNKAMQQHEKIANVLKPKYIEWIVLQKGIVEGRRIYFELVHKTPYCKEMYTIMNQLESTQLSPDFKEWEVINELGCEQFGNDNIDVWLNYVQFYFYYKVGDGDSQYKAIDIYTRAKDMLPDYLFLEFEEKYNQLINDFAVSI